MDEAIFSRIVKSADSKTLKRMLDASSFDELVEIDYLNNYCRNIYHVEDKYHVPVMASTYLDLYRYSLNQMIHPEDRPAYSGLMDPDRIAKRLDESECPGLIWADFRYKLADGGWRWVRQIVIGGKPFGMADGVIRFYVFDIQNAKDRELGVTETKRQVKQTRHPLTGLLPVSDFFETVKGFRKGAGEEWCLIAIDLEHFKLYNDWYGRDIGDLLLGEIGALLAKIEKLTGGVAGYLGQDDFALVAPYDIDKIKSFYNDIHDLVVTRGNSVGFLPAFGVCPLDKTSAIMDLYDQAAQAMKFAKGDYHNRIVLFHPKMYEETEHEYKILYDFQNALHSGEITFFLQPQCRSSSGCIVGAESLARWITKDGKMISPGEFVPILEKYGFISDLDEFIWDSVCAWLRRWLDEGHKAPSVSVNVSQVDILTLDVPKHFEMLLKKHSLTPDLIKIEITESSFAESMDIVKDTAQRLQALGFLVLMDDFGSGYSSLNMLGRIKVDVIKLDAQFLMLDKAGGKNAIRIVESVINMAKNMMLPIIVEGVETAEQLEFLTKLGCRYTQGYYFYRPMPIADFEKLISDESKIDTRGFIAKPNEQFRIREFLDQNIYNDSMLNSVIGPVAIYAQKGEVVDIVRFNEQFYETVNVSGFTERINDISRFIPEYELHAFYSLFDEAVGDMLNGATKMIHFRRPDNSYSYFLMHVYFLGEESGARKFYGSVRDVTKITRLDTEMNLLSKYSGACVLLLFKSSTGNHPRVILNGLESQLGLDRETLQSELNDNSFFDRVDRGDRQRLISVANTAEKDKNIITLPYRVKNREGVLLDTEITVHRVLDEGDVDVILTLKMK